MKALGNNELYCHLSMEERDRYTNKKIREAEFKPIRNYQELIEEIAKISYYNPGYSFFYRGQHEDYAITRESSEQASSLYPTIFRRKGESLPNIDLKARFDLLNEATEKTIEQFRSHEFTSWERMKKFPVLAWAVLQHYDVCRTPLLDVTHSARVAASFAFHRDDALLTDGYFYVLALPNPSEGIACSVDHEMVIMKLLSVCPPQAKRPFYQEGYLVGNFPFEALQKRPSYDLGCRLVAKFRLIRRDFWSVEFPEIPFVALMPGADEVKDICAQVRESLPDVP